LQPIRFWTNFGLGKIKDEIEMASGPMSPGSPFYAVERKSRSAGKITISFRGLRESYLAQSDLIDDKHAITVMIPGRLGWHHMFRRIDSAQISDFQ
jgi:hypothetical protein